MSADSRLQVLRRAALSGDPEAQARLLVERLRTAESCPECDGKGRTLSENKEEAKAALRACVSAEEIRQVMGAVQAGVYARPVPCKACVQFGSVLRARVALAAYCRDPAARLAMEPHETSAMHPPTVRHSLLEMLTGLSRWSAKPFHAPLRAALAASTRVAAFMAVEGEEPMRRVYDALDAVDAWLVEPTEANRVACYAFAEAESLPSWAAGPAYLVYHGSRGHALADNLSSSVLGAVHAHPQGEPAIRSAIQTALVSWALA